MPHMVTGSVASSLQGEPRATHDIDLVVGIRKSDAVKLAQAFPPPRFHLQEDSILHAIDELSMFTLLDVTEGGKVDFWVLTDEPFDQSRFSRRLGETFSGIEMQVSTPEDTILAKLRWAKLSGGSEKQFVDALRVYEVQFEGLDTGYLERWAEELGIQPLFGRLRQAAETM